MKKGKTNTGSAIFVSKKLISKAKWLGLYEITYKDENSTERKWESCERTTTPKSGVDGIDIICCVKKKNKKDQIMLVKQYRPPVKSYCLEFPAGLIDEDESLEKTALRELHEETGYHGKVLNVGPLLGMEPVNFIYV